MPPTFAGRFLLPRLPRFSARFPDVEVSISSSIGMAELSQGTVDAAIFRARTGTNEAAALIVEARLVAICAPELVEKQSPMEALAANPLIHTPQPDGVERQPEWRDWLAWRDLRHPNREGGPRLD